MTFKDGDKYVGEWKDDKKNVFMEECNRMRLKVLGPCIEHHLIFIVFIGINLCNRPNYWFT